MAQNAELFSPSIEPHETHGCLRGLVGDHARLGHREGGVPRAEEVVDVLGQEGRFTGESGLLRVERLREKSVVADVDEVARLRIFETGSELGDRADVSRVERPQP